MKKELKCWKILKNKNKALRVVTCVSRVYNNKYHSFQRVELSENFTTLIESDDISFDMKQKGKGKVKFCNVSKLKI